MNHSGSDLDISFIKRAALKPILTAARMQDFLSKDD
jgi:hypothetical protein